MTTSTHDIETGVIYDRASYGSFWRRVLADLVDAALLLLLYLGLALITPEENMNYLLLGWLAFAVLYLTLLKVSRFGTLGYKVAGLRIVNLNGGRVSIFSAVVRLFFAVVGPLNYGIDLLWIPNDPSRQALRDKFADTLVVRRGAAPVGTGKIVVRRLLFFGWNFLFREVARADGPSGTHGG
jgi:uncharacterized RDD family membrane protein YckC